ncbi:hypothetical protein FRC01_000562 [Tulasnella sp. 417]|nr:hypothetical protein FRC01_000562 [Tulasnella sp. 417]
MYARITDFGSARRVLQHDPNAQIEQVTSTPQSAQQLNATFCASTKSITLTGNQYTLRWAAPELLLEDQLSLWSDIWALGWVAYEVMTESLPFEDVASEVDVVERVVEGKMPSLADNAHLAVIHELCSLMSLCWKVQPIDRPTADSCRKSIEEMPRSAPEMAANETRLITAESLREMGNMYQSRGEHAKAFASFIDALEVAKRDSEEVADSLLHLTKLARIGSDYNQTIALYNMLWDAYDEVDPGDLYYIAEGFCDLDELHRHPNEALQLPSRDRTNEGRGKMANALCNTAHQRRREEEYEEAMKLFNKALGTSTYIGDAKGRADALWGLAEVHRGRREYEKALPLYREAIPLFTDLGDTLGRDAALSGVSSCEYSSGSLGP